MKALSANELRIGNLCHYYVSDDMEGDHVVLNAIDYEDLRILFGNDDENYRPIRLTEKWLLKFHNEEDIGKSKRFPNEITIYDRFIFIWKENYKYWYVATIYPHIYLTKIEFVHEYQNFIYILTGTELTIKL